MNTEVDVLYLLLLGEISLVLLVVIVVLLRKVAKYKALCLETHDNHPVPDNIAGPENIQASEPEAVPSVQSSVEEESVQAGAQPDKEISGISEEREAPIVEEETATEEADEDSLTGKVRKLERIANFQKNKIVDLMGYKDLFESAVKKLAAIQESNSELQEKFRTLTESSDRKEELVPAVEELESNNQKLSSFISILVKESNAISGKFAALEEQLKEMWEQSDAGGEVDEGQYSELLREKEELVSKLKEFENELHEKSKALDDMQKQYEDIESEYMILYKQQQQQQQP